MPGFLLAPGRYDLGRLLMLAVGGSADRAGSTESEWVSRGWTAHPVGLVKLSRCGVAIGNGFRPGAPAFSTAAGITAASTSTRQ